MTAIHTRVSTEYLRHGASTPWLAAWLDQRSVRHSGSTAHGPFSIVGGLPAPHRTSRLRHLSTLQWCWWDSTASGVTLPSTRPGAVGVMAKSTLSKRPKTPMELPEEDRGSDPSPRPGMRDRERERKENNEVYSKYLFISDTDVVVRRLWVVERSIWCMRPCSWDSRRLNGVCYRPVYFGHLADVYRRILIQHLRQVHRLQLFIITLSTVLCTVITRGAWQSQTWGRPAPQVRVQNQFKP